MRRVKFVTKFPQIKTQTTNFIKIKIVEFCLRLYINFLVQISIHEYIFKIIETIVKWDSFNQ